MKQHILQRLERNVMDYYDVACICGWQGFDYFDENEAQDAFNDHVTDAEFFFIATEAV